MTKKKLLLISTPDKENTTSDNDKPRPYQEEMDPMIKLRHLLSSMNKPSSELPVEQELNNSNAVTVTKKAPPNHVLDATCLPYNQDFLLRSQATGRTISVEEDSAADGEMIFQGAVEGLGLGKEKESLVITTSSTSSPIIGSPSLEKNHKKDDDNNNNESSSAQHKYQSIIKYGDTISIRSRAANDQALSVRKKQKHEQNAYEIGFYRTWLSQSEKFVIMPNRFTTKTIEDIIALRIPVRAGDEVLLVSVSTSGLLECVNRLKHTRRSIPIIGVPSTETETSKDEKNKTKVVESSSSLGICSHISLFGENGQTMMMSSITSSPASAKPGPNQTWQIMPAGVPFLPSWNYSNDRPYLSFDFLLNENREARMNMNMEMNMKQHGSSVCADVAELEKLLLNEMLDALMGFEGSFIRCRNKFSSTKITQKGDDGSSSSSSLLSKSTMIPQHCGINFIGPQNLNLRFEIEIAQNDPRIIDDYNNSDANINITLINLVQRMLPLCTNFVAVETFVSSRLARYEYGLVAQAFASAMDALVKEYLVLVAQLEALFSDDKLSLQKLWCFVQPSIRTFTVLANIVDATRLLKGGALLNVIDDALSRTADEKSCEILNFILQSASVPYFDMLSSWLLAGELMDAYEEFMVDAVTNDYNSSTTNHLNNFWDNRYTIRSQHVLHLLSKQEQQILTIGKYLNVIRECRKTIVNPLLNDENNNESSSSILRLESGILSIQSKIDAAFEFAASTLLTLVMKEHLLLDRLRSMKKYFLLDQGDFFVQFLDVAESELLQDLESISRDRIQSLLAMSIQTNVPDPFRDDLICDFAPLSLVDHLDSMYSWSGGLGAKEPKTPSRHAYGSNQSLTGIEAFMLDYKVEWPLSLVISRKAITNYQLLFRHLFFCKHVERRLFSTWLDHQTIKELNLRGELGRTYCLRQRMLHFLQNFMYYMMFEVIEPRWNEMEKRFGDAITIDDVLGVHEEFQNTVLKDCLLTSQDLLKILAKLMSTCLLFSEQMRRFFEANNVVSCSNLHSMSLVTLQHTYRNRNT